MRRENPILPAYFPPHVHRLILERLIINNLQKQRWIWVLSEVPKSRSNFDKTLIITHLQKPRMDVRWKTEVSPGPSKGQSVQRPGRRQQKSRTLKGTALSFFFRMSIIRHGAAFSEHRWLSLFPPSSSLTVLRKSSLREARGEHPFSQIFF